MVPSGHNKLSCPYSTLPNLPVQNCWAKLLSPFSWSYFIFKTQPRKFLISNKCSILSRGRDLPTFDIKDASDIAACFTYQSKDSSEISVKSVSQKVQWSAQTWKRIVPLTSVFFSCKYPVWLQLKLNHWGRHKSVAQKCGSSWFLRIILCSRHVWYKDQIEVYAVV